MHLACFGSLVICGPTLHYAFGQRFYHFARELIASVILYAGSIYVAHMREATGNLSVRGPVQNPAQHLRPDSQRLNDTI